MLARESGRPTVDPLRHRLSEGWWAKRESNPSLRTTPERGGSLLRSRPVITESGPWRVEGRGGAVACCEQFLSEPLGPRPDATDLRPGSIRALGCCESFLRNHSGALPHPTHAARSSKPMPLAEAKRMRPRAAAARMLFKERHHAIGRVDRFEAGRWLVANRRSRDYTLRNTGCLRGSAHSWRATCPSRRTAWTPTDAMDKATGSPSPGPSRVSWLPLPRAFFEKVFRQ
jgi:hypothetical protein